MLCENEKCDSSIANFTRKIGLCNEIGLAKVPMCHKWWEVCTYMNSVCGAIIFILSLTSSYCSLPNANRALHTGTPSYGSIQWDNQINTI